MISASDLANGINALLRANGFTTKITPMIDPVHAILIMGYRGPVHRPDWTFGIHIQTGGPVTFVKNESFVPAEMQNSASDLTDFIKKRLNAEGYSYYTRSFGTPPGLIFYAKTKPAPLLTRIKKWFGVI